MSGRCQRRKQTLFRTKTHLFVAVIVGGMRAASLAVEPVAVRQWAAPEDRLSATVALPRCWPRTWREERLGVNPKPRSASSATMQTRNAPNERPIVLIVALGYPTYVNSKKGKFRKLHA